MLSWDEFHIPETKKSVATTPNKPVEIKATVQASYIGDQELLAVERLKNMNLLGTSEKPFMGLSRIKAQDKKVIKGTSDVNQLIPFKHVWAWEKYLEASANHWMPQEISMTYDIAQWKDPNALTPDERLMVERTLGFFSTADTMVANNLTIAVYKNITSPEIRQYILTQIKEEGIHAHSYQYCIQSMGMDESEIFNMYREVPSIAEKMAWALNQTSKLDALVISPDSSIKEVQDFIEGLASYYCVVEGIFFYCGFAQLLSLKRRNKLPATGEQIEYILRDESMHANFGIDLINQIKIENPEAWTEELKQNIRNRFYEGYVLEMNYIKDTIPNGVLGLNATLHSDYLKIIANRRCEQLGIEPMFKGNIQHPYPWISEVIDLRKEKNFFETKPTDYQVGGLDWS